MLRLLTFAAQGLVAALIGWNTITALAGWRNRPPAAPGERARPVRAIIAAHDEEMVIAGVLSDLAAQDYQGPFEVVVVADRCTDRTAEIAAERSRVVARSEGEGGKGAALAWHLSAEPLSDDEVLLLLDADNRVSRDLITAIVDEVEAGHEVAQCYLDVSNPDASPLATASALSYWAGNRMVQLARDNLAWFPDLGGTGTVVTGRALAAAGGISDGLTEDLDLTARLALAGHRAAWLHTVRIFDEKPAGAADVVRQRARWMAGKRVVARRHGQELARRAAATRDPAYLDLAIRLVQPGRSFIALLSAGLTLVAASSRSALLWPWQVWGAITFVQLVLPVPFLARDGVAVKYLVRYPLLVVLGALWVPIRLVSSLVRGWSRTPHVGEADVKSEEPS